MSVERPGMSYSTSFGGGRRDYVRTLLSLDVHWMPIVHRASGCIAMRVFRVGGGRWWCAYTVAYCTVPGSYRVRLQVKYSQYCTVVCTLYTTVL